MTIKFHSLFYLMVGAWIAVGILHVAGIEVTVVKEVSFTSGFLLGIYLLKKYGFLEKA